jgi:hypothetical protein
MLFVILCYGFGKIANRKSMNITFDGLLNAFTTVIGLISGLSDRVLIVMAQAIIGSLVLLALVIAIKK